MTFSINPTAAKTQAMFQSMAIALNGTGAGSAITGGAAGAAAAAPAAGAAGAASNSTAAAGAAAGKGSASAGTGSTGTTTGTGTLQNGQCQCAVTCTAGSLPAANVQGVGSFGGIPGKLSVVFTSHVLGTIANSCLGSLPMAMSEPMINAALGA